MVDVVQLEHSVVKDASQLVNHAIEASGEQDDVEDASLHLDPFLERGCVFLLLTSFKCCQNPENTDHIDETGTCWKSVDIHITAVVEDALAPF